MQADKRNNNLLMHRGTQIYRHIQYGSWAI